MDLKKAEIKLLNYIRELEYGEFVVKVRNGLPVMIERPKKNVDLTTE